VGASSEQIAAAAARIDARRDTDGNERLTALTAAILLVLLALEGVTIVFLRPLISVHLFVGLLLMGPLAVKLASTGYRFARYYTRDADYRAKGPPPALLRWSAPLVLATTIAVFATGIWLLLAGPDVSGTVKPLHKLSFIAWLAVTGLHVLGHLPAVVRGVQGEVGGRGEARSRARLGRQALLLAALLAGIALALAFLPDYGLWQHAQHLRG
jgi:hypothetical protein